MGIFEYHQHLEFGDADNILERLKKAVFGDQKRLSEKEKEELAKNIKKYLEVFYEKNRYLNTIVFEGIKKELKDLYIPIKIRAVGETQHLFNMNELECLSVFMEHKKILIVDTAGMGKSTLVKFMSTNICEKHLSEDMCKENKVLLPLPIVIELRKLDNPQNIIGEMKKELSLISSEFSEDIIRLMLEEGDLCVFLDGYDELDEEKKGPFSDAICELADKAKESFFVMTSRDESTLAGFRGFEQFNIEPFSEDMAYELIKKYDQNGEVSKELIPALKSDENMKNLKEFLSNPLLTSLLYMAYKHRNIIPNRKHLFYAQVYEALFQGHDQTKGGGFVHPKDSGLDKESFQKVLDRLAFLCISQNKISMDEDELDYFINKSIESLPAGKTTRRGVKLDLLRSVPLIQKDGLTYQWVHKSFAEYFAACFICKDSPDKHERLKKIAFGNKFNVYSNVFDFCFDMDEGAVREAVVKELLEDYIKYDKSVYQDVHYKDFPENLIAKAKSIQFFAYIRFVKKYLNPADYEEFKECPFEDGNLRILSRMAGKEYTIVHYDRKYANVIQVLFKKGVDIFSESLGDNQRDHEKYNVLNNTGEFSDFFLDDNADAFYNQLDCFKEIVGVLTISRDRQYYFDVDKCKKVLSEIETEIKAQKDDIFDI